MYDKSCAKSGGPCIKKSDS